MDRAELIALVVAGCVIVGAIVVVFVLPALGGSRSGFIDQGGDGGAGGD